MPQDYQAYRDYLAKREAEAAEPASAYEVPPQPEPVEVDETEPETDDE